MDILEKMGLEIAFPSQSIYLENTTETLEQEISEKS